MQKWKHFDDTHFTRVVINVDHLYWFHVYASEFIVHKPSCDDYVVVSWSAAIFSHVIGYNNMNSDRGNMIVTRGDITLFTPFACMWSLLRCSFHMTLTLSFSWMVFRSFEIWAGTWFQSPIGDKKAKTVLYVLTVEILVRVLADVQSSLICLSTR